MAFLEPLLRRWHARLEAQLRTLDQPGVLERFSYPLPSFSTDERQAILAWVRRRVEDSFHSHIPDSLRLPAQSHGPINLDVAFWVRGELRASAILAENLPLADALERCTERALHDGRFRPLEEDELAHLRIELTFFGPWQPIERSMVEHTPLLYSHGYVATLEGTPRAWYLPMVHNAIRFETLTALTESLLRKKGGLTSAATRRAALYHFPTLGFIESADRQRPISLVGPLVAENEAQTAGRLLDASLAWLLRQETVPGYFLSERIPGKLDERMIDWARIGFSAATLAEAGVTIDRDDCRSAAKRTLAYLDRELGPARFIRPEAKCLAAVYAGLTAAQLDDAAAAGRWLDRAQQFLAFEHLSPIAHLLAGKLLATQGRVGESRHIFELQYSSWLTQRDTAQLALYPELVPLALALHEKTREDSFREKALAVGDWYAGRQLADGSFPFALGSSRAPYLRGSGKILEALACLPERYDETLTRGFRFAKSLQYTPDSMYHIPLVQQEEFLGGFRHDLSNREAWIDAAGHLILALVRMRASNREEEANQKGEVGA